MNSLAFIVQAAFIYINVLSVFGQSQSDSLENVLLNAESDTARISILIDYVDQFGESEDAIPFLKKAFELSLNVTSVRHQSRAEITYGSFLAETDLDAGISLIDQGIKRYQQENMLYYLTDGLYIKGQTLEIENQLDSAAQAYTLAFEIASNNAFHQESGDAAFALSVLNNLRGNNVNALEWGFEAKKAYELAGSKDELMSDVLNQIGIIYDQQRLYPKALECYLQAKEHATKARYIEGILQTDNNIGVIYDNMNLPETALSYFTDALEEARMNNLIYDEAILLNNISFLQQRSGDTTVAVALLKQTLTIDVSEYDECFPSYPLEALGSLYMFTGKLDSAKLLLEQALKVATKCDEAAILSSIYKSLGLLYSKQKRLSSAKSMLQMALQIANEARLPVETNEALYELYAFHDEARQHLYALKYLKKYTHFNDSLTKITSIEKATKLAAEYEFRKEVVRLEEERITSERLLADEIEAKSRTNKIALVVSILLLAVVMIFVRGNALIRKRNKQLAQINAEKNKLIGIVAHDLRNPLNMIQGLLPLLEELRKDVSHPDFPQYLDMMNQSTHKMKLMIDRTLDLSAIENMRLNLEMQKTNLNQLILKSIENFELIAGKKEINIVHNIERQEDYSSIVDPNYLEQVLDNLIANAIKFSENGKEIFIGLVNYNQKNLIEVRDHGPGISEADQQNIYQAFRTTSNKPTAHETSTGLGLSIAYRFVDAMAGEIKLNSTVGKGTSFIVSFKEA